MSKWLVEELEVQDRLMLCPACVQDGRYDSIIYPSEGETINSVSRTDTYTDEEGVVHKHGNRKVLRKYACTKASHLLMVEWYKPCESCGWQHDENRIMLVK
jgi:hypothetical protein